MALRDHVVAILAAMEPELRRSGIERMALFGSVARGEERPDSDVDLAVALDPAARLDLVHLIQIEHRLEAALGRPVDLLTLPISKPRLRRYVEQDLMSVF